MPQGFPHNQGRDDWHKPLSLYKLPKGSWIGLLYRRQVPGRGKSISRSSALSHSHSEADNNTQNVTYNDPDSVIKTHVDGTGELASGIQRSFCGNCGSLIRISSINYPQFVSVPFGIIDSDEKADLKPTTEFFCDRRVDWVAAVEGSTKFATMPTV